MSTVAVDFGYYGSLGGTAGFILGEDMIYYIHDG
jgi:hypothetical protein